MQQVPVADTPAENPRVGGSIPSLATRVKQRAIIAWIWDRSLFKSPAGRDTASPRARRFRGRQAAPLDSRPVQPMVTNAASRRPSLFDASNVIAPGRIAGRRGGALPRTGRHGMRGHESDARAGASSCRAIPDHSGAPAPPGQARRIPARSRDADHALRSRQHGAPHVVGAPGRSPPGCLRTPAAGLSGTGVRPRDQRNLDPTDARLGLQGAGELPPGCRPAGRDPLGPDAGRAVPRASNAPAAPPAGAGAWGPIGQCVGERRRADGGLGATAGAVGHPRRGDRGRAPLPLSRHSPGRGALVLPAGVHREAHRPPRALQAQYPPPAPDRRPGVAAGDQEVPAPHPGRAPGGRRPSWGRTSIPTSAMARPTVASTLRSRCASSWRTPPRVTSRSSPRSRCRGTRGRPSPPTRSCRAPAGRSRCRPGGACTKTSSARASRPSRSSRTCSRR